MASSDQHTPLSRNKLRAQLTDAELTLHSLKTENVRLKFQVQALESELARLKESHEEHIAELKRVYDSRHDTLKKESAAWRATNEDEFCRLIATTTRHMSTFQDKFERTLKREAFLNRKYSEVKKERDMLQAKLENIAPQITT